VPPEEEVDAAGRLPNGVLWELLRDGSRKLDPRTIYDQESSRPEGTGEQFQTRYVLLGGPGSGKSTVGQFLAQIHRASLLDRREPYLLEPQSRQIIRETHELCDQEGLRWPATPRYPFRVELNRFAKSLASHDSDHVDTLEGYLLNSLKREHALTHEVLLEWLAAYPWLLILDGLDEVPATSNRDALVKAINDFLAEARQVGADIFVVATSRLQGYSGEFTSGVVAIRHILPLSTVRAVRYVESYAKARFGATDPTKAQDVVDKLRQSARSELTAQLMVSPLQVTFMATVVAAKGDPGEDRWQLFDSYYRTIYDRERQKAVPPYDAVLSKQQPIVDRLHHDIGFWLQFRGETAGGTSVSLPITQFESLVDAYLSEIGREGEEKDKMVGLITKAARDRLVFLTSRVVGELSFEVRSLQEYMAAECLMSGDADVVRPRLKAIAPAAYWRNVFLFAASKCFADARSRHLQDSIRLLCEDLNSPSDQLLSATRAGSDLAIDVLQSGAVSQNPNHGRHLARLGLAILSHPFLAGDSEEAAASDRLAIVYSDALKTVYREDLELRIGQTDADRSAGAWSLVVRLVDKGVDWAIRLDENRWPAESRAEILTLRQMRASSVSFDWLRQKVDKLIWELPPSEASDLINLLRFPHNESEEPLDPLGALLWVTGRRESLALDVAVKFKDEGIRGFDMEIIPAFTLDPNSMRSFEMLARMPQGHPGWLPFALAQSFLESPNARTLAKILNECADADWSISEKHFLDALPWPLASCLLAARSADVLRGLAERVESGVLGDSSDWQADEKRLMSEGVRLDGLCSRTAGTVMLEGENRFLVPPFRIAGVVHHKYSQSVVEELAASAEKMVSSPERDAVLWCLCIAGAASGGIAQYLDPSRFRVLCEGHTEQGWWYRNYVGDVENPDTIDAWLQFFDWLGHSDALSSYYDPENEDSVLCDILQEAFLGDHARWGLLRLLGRFASNGLSIELIPSEMLNPESFSQPRFRLAAILVRMTQHDLAEDEAVDLAERSTGLLSPSAEPGANNLLFKTAAQHLNRIPALETFLLRLHEIMPTGVELGISNCERLLRQVQRQRSSDLHGPDQLQKLQLPTVHSF